MYVLALATILVRTALAAHSIRWNLDNVAGIGAWRDLISPYINELINITDNNVVTILIPSDSAVDDYTSSSSFQGQNSDSIRHLMRYHILKGHHETKDIVAAGPMLRTMFNQRGISGGQRVQVSGMLRSDGENDKVMFYSGMGQNSSIWEHGGDFDADGTKLHIIESVLTIPLSISETTLAAGLASFAGAVTTANIDIHSLQDATYFVPTNNAFQSVGSAMIDASESGLREVLEYHYVNTSTSPLYTSMIDTAQQKTAGGGSVRLSYSNDNDLFINSAAVTQANILVANGVMHITDQVLNPNSNLTGRPAGSIGRPAFPNATRTNAPPFVNAVAGVSDLPGATLGSGPAETPLGELAPGYSRQRQRTEENAGVSLKRCTNALMVSLGVAIVVALLM